MFKFPFFFLSKQDAVLEKYFSKDIFRDKKLQDIGRPKKSLFVRRCYNNVVLFSCSFHFSLFLICSCCFIWTGYDFLVKSAWLCHCQVIPMAVIIPSLMGSHCIFNCFLVPRDNYYANSYSIIGVRALYACNQFHIIGRNEAEAPSKIIVGCGACHRKKLMKENKTGKVISSAQKWCVAVYGNLIMDLVSNNL